MTVKIDPSWNKELAEEWNKPYFANLTEFVKQEYATKQVFPPGSQIFAAFDATPFDKVKVVIIGQDPYHDPLLQWQRTVLPGWKLSQRLTHPPHIRLL